MADIQALMNGVGASLAPFQNQLNSVWGQLPGEFQTYLSGMGISGTPATTTATPTPPPAPGVATTPAPPSHHAGGKNPFTPGVPYSGAGTQATTPQPTNPFTDGGGGGGAANTFASYAPPNWQDYTNLASVQGSGIAYDGNTFFDWNLDPTNSMGYGTGARVGSPFGNYGDYGNY